MARASWCVAAAVALAMLAPSPAGAQSKRLRIAVYAPWSGPSTADDRYAFALKLEDGVKAAGQSEVKVSTFAKLKDFRRAVAGGNVDIAVVDAGATEVLGKRLEVVAAWSSGEPWVLAGTSRYSDLSNKRLALQAHDAKSSARLVETLLRGEARAGYWTKIVGAPVTEDARQLVLRDLADVVVIPKRLAADMTELADVGRFSELALAATDTKSPALAAVKSSVLDSLGGSWANGEPVFPKRVAVTRLVAAAVSDSALTILDLLAPPDPAMPELALDSLWIKPDAP